MTATATSAVSSAPSRDAQSAADLAVRAQPAGTPTDGPSFQAMLDRATSPGEEAAKPTEATETAPTDEASTDDPKARAAAEASAALTLAALLVQPTPAPPEAAKPTGEAARSDAVSAVSLDASSSGVPAELDTAGGAAVAASSATAAASAGPGTLGEAPQPAAESAAASAAAAPTSESAAGAGGASTAGAPTGGALGQSGAAAGAMAVGAEAGKVGAEPGKADGQAQATPSGPPRATKTANTDHQTVAASDGAGTTGPSGSDLTKAVGSPAAERPAEGRSGESQDGAARPAGESPQVGETAGADPTAKTGESAPGQAGASGRPAEPAWPAEAAAQKGETTVELPDGGLAPALGGNVAAPVERAAPPSGHQAPAPAAPPPSSPVEQVLANARVFTTAEGKGLRFRLDPPELGVLNVRIAVESGRVVLHVAAETPQAREAIQAGWPRLQEGLAERGLRAERLTIEQSQASTASAGGGASSGWSGPRQAAAYRIVLEEGGARRPAQPVQGGDPIERPRVSSTSLIDYRI